MKISYNWILETIDVPTDAQTLAHELTMVGLQLESLQEFQGDFIFDFEVTVNRPDCLSLFGICREVAAVFALPAPVLPPIHPLETIPVDGTEGRMTAGDHPLRIILADPDLCARYCGQIVTGVKVGPSPEWMRRKLEACGLRSINNVVDITNYVMLELGQPLHAFDYNQLTEGTIRVRQAQNETLMMIDERERRLTAPMLVIADANRAVAVAGVMGGTETEVTESTHTLLLESAYFQPSSVRKTAKTLELSTDASYRFERGADNRMQAIAIRRAALLLEELAGGKAHPVLDVAANTPAALQIRLRPERIEQILGENIDPHFVDNTLMSLGFLKRSERDWEVPSFRVDVSKEIDLIEEVARIYGYNRFPSTLPAAGRKYQPDYPAYQWERDLSQLLRASGLDEASCFSLVNPASAFQPSEERIKVVNPISESASELRTSLIPGLLESIEHNLRHRNSQVRLFEIGHVFPLSGERTTVGIALVGDFRDLKGILEAVFPALRCPLPSFADGTITAAGRRIGTFVQTAIESHPVQACELFLGELLALPRTEIRYDPIIPYPYVERDASFVLAETIPYRDLQAAFDGLKMRELKAYKLIDRYQGKHIPPGKVGLTFQLIFQREDRTLTSEEVDRFYSVIVEEFATRFQAELRK